MAVDNVITLRQTVISDLELFFTFQLDNEARYLAAFTSNESIDKTAYTEKYSRFLANPTIHMRTILMNNLIVGSISKFEMDGEAELTYWLNKTVWGKGIATAALAKFLTIEPARPIFARVAFDNFGSQRVLEKNGFVRIGKEAGFANARQTEIEEFIYKLA